MVAQPVAWYDKPGSPALPREAPSSVSAMAAVNNGEVGAAAPGAHRRFSPYDVAAPTTGTTANPAVVP